MAKPEYRYRHVQARRDLLAGGRLCAHCGSLPATVADHQPPLSLHRHVQGTGCCQLVPSCAPCSQVQAGQLGGLWPPRINETVELVEPPGFDVDDLVWGVHWLDDLREVPANATWPRLMTVPHPRAVDSLGAEVAAWALERRGVEWRWWQKLYTARLLEVDAAGRLCWEASLLSMSRQLGKSWWLHDICAWRLEQGERFGEPQCVLSTAKDVPVARMAQTPSRARAKRMPELYRVRLVNGDEGITYLVDGSEWLVRSQSGVYGQSVTMGTVDEGWDVDAHVVDLGLLPTMLARQQTQLLLISTAHRRATSLMIGRRATALDQIASPDDDSLLIVEWSSPRWLDRTDRSGWRMASPYWDEKRERWIAKRLEAAMAGESADVNELDPLEAFDSQYLNRWPARRVAVQKGVPLVEAEQWVVAGTDVDTTGPLVIAVEDNLGQGAAVAYCGRMGDDRWVLGGEITANRAEAFALAELAATERPGSTVVVGASLITDPAVADMPATIVRAGTRETRDALPLLRNDLATGRVAHDGATSPHLGEQVLAARVTEGAGLTLIPAHRSDLLRGACWALRQAHIEAAFSPGVH